MNAPSDTLERFVRAQERDYAQALTELTAGRKRSHWIWYVLPQLRGLGHSGMARHYGIAGRDEAAAYFAHPILGPRLIECVNAILAHADRSAVEVLGNVDAMKFRSCLTLFAEVAPAEPCFSAALAVFYQGKPDSETLRLLAAASRSGLTSQRKPRRSTAMPVVPGTALILSDQQEGWFPLAAPRLHGQVVRVLLGQATGTPLYVVALDEPLEVQESGATTPSGLSAVFYRNAIIKSRWEGTDICTERDVSVYVLLPPDGEVTMSRADILKLPVRAWAHCNLVE